MKLRTNWMRAVLFTSFAILPAITAYLPAYASDHREAPTVDQHADGDITDVYCFTDPNNTANFILIMNVNGFANSSEAASYSFNPDFLYQFKIDNTGDFKEDLVIQVVFDQDGTGQTASIFGPAAPTVVGARNVLLGTQPTVSVPFNSMVTGSNGVIGFVGLRDDPFVFDFAQFTRILNGQQDLFRAVGTSFRGRPVRADGTSGVDSFGGFNVTTIAVSVPKSLVRGSTSMINVWATVSSRVPVRQGPKTFTQFERAAQQAFATIFIPKGAARDAENFEIPSDDVANYSGLVPDALTTTDNDGTGNNIAGRAATLTALGLTAPPNGAPLLLPGTFGNTDKNLLREALLPDVLRFDMDLDPTNFAQGQFGLQNGRELNFSSIDNALQLLRSLSDVQFPSGSGIPGSGPAGTRAALQCTQYPQCEDRRVLVVLQGTQWIKADSTVSDYTTVGNDQPFLATFPYIAAPAPLPGAPGTIGYPPQQ
jgi:hypothetical protein